MQSDFHNEVAIYYLVGTVFVIILVAAIIFYVLLHQKKVNSFRRRLEEEEINRQKAIYAALQEGEEKERNRIAEELHDGISAKLSGLNMNLDYLRVTTEKTESRDLVDKTFSGISDIINELRILSHDLHSNYFEGRDLGTLLEDYISQLNQKGVCKYSMFVETDFSNLNSNLKLNIYRIITELLHNIEKHAQAAEGILQISVNEADLIIIVSDDGIGFTKSDTSGIGLANISNRVQAGKGKINIDTSPKGTTIIIEMPIEK